MSRDSVAKLISVIFLAIFLLFVIYVIIWLYLSNYWIGEKVDDVVIKTNSKYTVEENIPDDIGLRVMLSTTNDIHPNIHEKLPNKVYNPSAIYINDIGYVILSKVTSFSKCNDTRDLSNEIYDKSPEQHSSGIILTYYTYDGSSGSTLLDIPVNYDFVPKRPFVPGYEDPRPFIYDNGLWFLCNARLNSALGKSRMFLVYVCELGEITRLETIKKCVAYKIETELIKQSKDEKNWSPILDSVTTLKIVYSILPLTILEIQLPNKEDRTRDILYRKVQKITSTKEYTELSSQLDTSLLRYPSDTLRCSTQVIPIDNDYYLSFGHIREGERYWLFPYTFRYINKEYKLLNIGEPREILGSNTQCYVSGFAYEQDKYHLTFGINDCHSGSITLTKKDVVDWVGSTY